MTMHRSLYGILPVVLALLLAGCGSAPPQGQRVDAVGAVNAQDTTGRDTSGFARATEPRTFRFPADHGPHPDYQIEWWYYTGNLTSADGRRFGFQLTFFRSALRAAQPPRESAWAARDVYLAHFGLTDAANGQFYSFERLNRGAAGLANATGEPAFRVFVEDWSAEAITADATQMRLRASNDDVGLDLALTQRKPPVLQGDAGLSPKSATPGYASYYYSLTRLATEGTLTIGDERIAVTGLSWMDHEFSTESLPPGVVGWDWFSLQLDNQYELMYFQVRDEQGAPLYVSGTLVAPDGSTQQLGAGDVQLAVRARWQSPHTGATYPVGWQLALPELGLELDLTPLLEDQEMRTAIVYWEGAVDASGTQGGQSVLGSGYVEMTGYADTARGRY